MFELQAEVTYKDGYSLKVRASGHTLHEVFTWLNSHIKLTNSPVKSVVVVILSEDT